MPDRPPPARSEPAIEPEPTGRRQPPSALVAAGAMVMLIVVGLATGVGRSRSAHRVETGPPGTSDTTPPADLLPFAGELLTPRPYGAASSKPADPALTAAAAPTATPATAAPPTAPPTSRAARTTAPPPAATEWPVADPDDWATAVAGARPGDTIRLVATITQPLQYRGPLYQPEKQKGPGGTPGRPITITAAPGVWIDPGDEGNNVGALDVLYAANVHVVGIRVRHSQFGIRIIQSSGTAAAPLAVRNNTVTDIGHAGIHVGGNFATHTPSHHVRVEGNTITRTGQRDPEYGEGVYLGYGAQEWVDQTSNVAVVNNDISYTGAEGVDIKPGVRHVLVQGNTIHDLSPIAGGAISACYVGGTPDPAPGQSADVVLRRNRIWNIDLDGRSGSNDWAIWVGHGGVTVEANAVWGLRGDPSSTRAVRVRSPVPFGSFPIRIVDNLFWTATGWVAEGSPSGSGLVRASGNRGPEGAAGVELKLAARKAAPPIGGGGTADSGKGPGSALGF